MPPSISRPLVVLAVDDTPGVHALYARLVADRPRWMLVSAENGAVGIEVARERQPDLILLDNSMPVLDGLTALARLRADPLFADTPIAMVSAEPDIEQVTLASGATWFVHKRSAPRLVAAVLDAVAAGHDGAAPPFRSP